MPKGPDSGQRLSGSRLCEISGVNRQTRDKWARDGLLRKGDEYDEFDLVEVVVLHLLLDKLRKKDAKVAWARVRPQLRGLLPGPKLTLVWDGQCRTADLVIDDDAIVSLVRHGRPVQVVDLGTEVRRARDAFRRDIGAAGAVDGTARQAPRGVRGATGKTRS